MNWHHWLTHPHELPRRLRYWAWEKMNPDKPWLCPGTVRFCERHFAGAVRGLEYGSGRSTRWFAGLASQLVSVESSARWYERVKEDLRKSRVVNVDYRYVPLEHPEAEAEQVRCDPPPAYARVVNEFSDGTLDFVLVDGHYRDYCIRLSAPKIRRGGHLVIDDVNFWPSQDLLPVPSHWPVVDDSTTGLKRCLIFRAV